jgi:peptidoglycan-N-acetylglucosamine deacetylase
VIKIVKKHIVAVICIIALFLIPFVYLKTNIYNINTNTPKDVNVNSIGIGDTDTIDHADSNIATATTTNVNTAVANTNSINVKAAQRKRVNNRKVIYLTFDDGPTTPITDIILDILKDKKVNATFFVIGNKVKLKASLIKRIYNEGNGIGLHTFTHDYSKIYRSQEAFICEMDRSAEEIYDVLGIRPNIIRFPTGSIGHLNKTLYQKLKEKHYRIYDWNARITDGVHPNKSPYTFYREAVKSGRKWDTIFMLMHCDALNSNTCKALSKIIDYYKDNDFEFKIIDQNTPEYYFRYEKKKSS